MKKILVLLCLGGSLHTAAQIDEIRKRDSIGRVLLLSDTVPKKISLQEILVRGKKPPVNFKLDRQIFRAGEFANAANGSAVDLIRNLPSVAVNANGEITVRGSSSFLVLINGKPTQGDPAFVLSQLAASTIENIEVISSPGAAFDADGKSGVINIITKTAQEQGLLIQANLMQGTPPLNDYDNQRYTDPQRRSADVSLAYQKGKWDLSTGFNYLRNDMAGYREGDVYTVIGNTKTSFPSNGERSFKRYNYGGRLAVAYEINANNKIEAGAYLGKRFQSRVADLLYNNSRTNQLTGVRSSFDYFNKNTQDKEGVFSLVTLGSQHKLGKSTQLSFSGQYEGADLKGLVTNDNLTYPGLASFLQKTSNPSTNPLHAYRVKADLTSKKGTATWQTGYQFRYDVQKGSFDYFYMNAGSTVFQLDPFFTSRVNVTNHIHGAYVQRTAVKDKWTYQWGMRAEQMVRNLDFSQGNAKKQLSLLNLFPSYLIRYAAGESTTLKTGFSRRIKRTNNFELNPFPEREHSETLEQGDPELLPELTASWELGLEQKLGRGSWYLTAYYQRIKNPIQRVNKVFNDTILNRVFTNAGLATQLGVESNVTYRIGKVWQLILGGNIYKYNIRGAIFNGTTPVSNQSWVYSLNTTSSFSFQRNWNLQFNLSYLSLRATAQGEDGAFLVPNLTVKKSTNDRRWNFQASWLFMDGCLGISNIQRISTWGSNFYTTTNYIYEPDQLQFSVGFNLSRKNRKINLPQSEMAEKEF